MSIITGRETKADWEYPAGQIISTSLSTTLRPDALVPDYKTSFTYGPPSIGDTSAGVLQRIWRADVVSGSTTQVTVRAAESASYTSSSVLFSYTTNATGTIKELDLAFSIDARPVVCAEVTNGVSSSIYLYWFNAFISNFQFIQFDHSGTTPRLLLDNPASGTNDVLLFYISGNNDVVRFRQQRDQYNTVYNIPLPVSASANEETYLEDVVKLDDSRVRIYYSRRNVSTNRWELYGVDSVLYPFYVQEEFLSSNASFVSASLRDVLIYYNHTGSLTTDALLFDSRSVALTSQSWEFKLYKYFYTGSLTSEAIFFDSRSLSLVTQSWEATLLSTSFSDTLTSHTIAFVTASLLNTLLSYTPYTDVLTTQSVTLLTASLV
jgi:hypothetical protein